MQHVCGQPWACAALKVLPSVPPCRVELVGLCKHPGESHPSLGSAYHPLLPRVVIISWHWLRSAGLSQWSITLRLNEQGVGAKGDFLGVCIQN